MPPQLARHCPLLSKDGGSADVAQPRRKVETWNSDVGTRWMAGLAPIGWVELVLGCHFQLVKP